MSLTSVSRNCSVCMSACIYLCMSVYSICNPRQCLSVSFMACPQASVTPSFASPEGLDVEAVPVVVLKAYRAAEDTGSVDRYLGSGLVYTSALIDPEDPYKSSWVTLNVRHCADFISTHTLSARVFVPLNVSVNWVCVSTSVWMSV